LTSIDERIDHSLKDFFGFDSFKGNQRPVIKSLLEGRDAFVIMPTGGGKSLCYQLPAIIMEGTAIIISPLIALMKNQVDHMRAFGAKKGVAHFMNSSLVKKDIDQVKEDILSGITKMLYVAPETFTKDDTRKLLKKIKVSFIAIDEAHCISEWGHDFRPEYRKIREVVDAYGNVPLMALTASATVKVQDDILNNLRIEEAEIYKSSFDRPNLYYEVKPKVSGKAAIKDIVSYIKKNPGTNGIIYCLTRKKVEELAETLRLNNISATEYHAGMESTLRSRNQDLYLMEEVNVIVATIAFGMGIDKPDVRFVIHYDVPKSIESYYQETGRAGRDGLPADCILYYNYNDLQKLEKLFRDKHYYEREKSTQLLRQMAAFAENANCRRRALLHYFGEKYESNECEEKKMCSNCRHPKKQFDGKEYLLVLLKTLEELKGDYSLDHIVYVLIGDKTQSVTDYNHQNVKSFGIGKEKDFNFWKSIIRKAIIDDLLTYHIETFGTLSVSEQGRKYQEEPYPIMIAIDEDFSKDEDDDDEVHAGGRGGADETLYNMLKVVRKKIAKNHDVPPYVVFQDPSLEEMSIKYPISSDELTQIVGVSATKAQRYGNPFLDIIRKYVEENEIERPDDLVVKSVANKSKMKVFIIQSIDRKIPLEDIAQAKGISMEELLDEIENIVYSGTRVNINYYINEILDEEYQAEIFDYFRNSESDSLDKAVNDLGVDVYSREEIQLMRIKFISEMAN
jgi:ATP-dependent DNA helicase RecQ